MSNWDDDDYDVDTASSALKASWDDEIEGDALDSWENASDDDEPKAAAAPTRQRVPLKQKLKEKEEKERLELEANALALKEEDSAAKKERLKQVEQSNDMDNLADLMGGADVHPRSKQTSKVAAAVATPAKLSDFQVFHPSTKQEFETLRKTIVPILSDTAPASNLHYSNLVTDIARDLCKPLNQDQIRKIVSTLNAVISDKQRAERANRGKKPKAQLKAASAKKEDKLDTTNYEDDDLDDDDFM